MAILLTLTLWAAPLAAAGPGPTPARGSAGGPAGRCAALLALFDEIVVSRFDNRLLVLEHDELAEASAARDQADLDCTAGRYGFGIPLIESALRRIGIVPPPD